MQVNSPTVSGLGGRNGKVTVKLIILRRGLDLDETWATRRSHAGPRAEGNGDPARRAVEIAAIGKLSKLSPHYQGLEDSA
jgi:hypothetical protein